MSRRACTCPPDAFPDTACPRHGLYGTIAHPPADRHALPGETAEQAQRRLYLAAAQDRVRVEAAGFRYPVRLANVPSRFGQR